MTFIPSEEFVCDWLFADYCERLKPIRSKRMRAARAKGRHTAAQWEVLKNKFGNRCAICRKPCRQVKDHIVAVAMGGSDSIKNIQPLCQSCNSKKGTKTARAGELPDGGAR